MIKGQNTHKPGTALWQVRMGLCSRILSCKSPGAYQSRPRPLGSSHRAPGSSHSMATLGTTFSILPLAYIISSQAALTPQGCTWRMQMVLANIQVSLIGTRVVLVVICTSSK